jgi:hypothetical protein
MKEIKDSRKKKENQKYKCQRGLEMVSVNYKERGKKKKRNLRNEYSGISESKKKR